MNIDPEMLNKLKSMNQKELSYAIESICRMMGANEGVAKSLSRDPDAVMQKLNDLSSADINAMLSRVDKKSLEAIKKNIQER